MQEGATLITPLLSMVKSDGIVSISEARSGDDYGGVDKRVVDYDLTKFLTNLTFFLQKCKVILARGYWVKVQFLTKLRFFLIPV